MAWSETGTEVQTETRQFWIVEWAEYNDEFTAVHGTVSGATEGDRVWRKLVAQDADMEWRGMTWAAAGTKVATLVQGEAGSEYQGARRRRIPGGGANVYATRRTYDPAGWSGWALESTYPTTA
jgi:hypothetical protein